jgi:hypothetical protein
MDFEGRAKSLDCVALWRQLEDVATQYSWTVNARCSHMSMGSSLKGQAKEVIRQAKAAGDEILNSATPLVGDIVAGLMKYYQLKFRYLVLVGKPTHGAVINKWMEEVLFDTDNADGKLSKYQEIRKYHLMKSSSTPADLYNELARQSAKTEVGKSWWREITQRLRQTEEMQIQIRNPWTLTHEVLQNVVESLYNLELSEEQSVRSSKPAAKMGFVVNALKTDEAVSDRSRSSSPPERGKSTYSKDKGRDQYRKSSGY